MLIFLLERDMTIINGSNTFDDVEFLDTDEKVEGGKDGASNKQAVALVGRTNYLKDEGEKTKQKVDGLQPQDIGAANKVHKHLSTDISDLATTIQMAIQENIKPGYGVSVSVNPMDGSIVVATAEGASPSDARPFIVETRAGSNANQTHIFSFNLQSDFDLNAYALKLEPGATGQNNVIGNFSASAEQNYNSTPDLMYASGLVVKNGYRSFTFYDETDKGFVTKDFVSANQRLFNISIPDKQISIVPVMTGPSSPLGYAASASSQYSADFPAYKAFDQVNGKSDWSSISSDTTPWIRVDLPAAVAIQSYELTRYSSSVAVFMKSWRFQGSNDNGQTWEDIDVVTNNTKTSQVMLFTLAEPVKYKSYRFQIVARTDDNREVQIREIRFYPPEGKFVLKSPEGYYSVVNGGIQKVAELTENLDSVLTQYGITSTGDFEATLFPNNFRFISNARLDPVIKTAPKAQVAVPKYLVSVSHLSNINSMFVNVIKTLGIVAQVKVLVTRDLSNWFTFNNNQWVRANAPENDSSRAQEVIDNGISPDVLQSIPKSSWFDLYGDRKGMPDFLALAVAIDVPAISDGTVTVASVNVNADNAGAWRRQTSDQVEIRWYASAVAFKTITAGDYKLAYQIP